VWTGGDASGVISVKNLYKVLNLSQIHPTLSGWMVHLWKWQIQLKIKLFLWLAANHKVLTWDSLQKRGWEGPGVCLLCNCDSEDIDHLLIHCKFAKAVWACIYNFYHQKTKWVGNTVFDCFKNWTKDKTTPSSLAAMACCHLWKQRNMTIFEGQIPSHQAVAHRIFVAFSWRPSTLKTIQNRVCNITQSKDFSVACFDGATFANGKCCGAGGIIKFHETKILKWYINCGASTNTKAELMGLWATLTMATHWSIKKLQVLGDSKVIIDWINHKGQLHATNFEGWKLKTRELTTSFQDIKF
jgi:hypothetical protein